MAKAYRRRAIASCDRAYNLDLAYFAAYPCETRFYRLALRGEVLLNEDTGFVEPQEGDVIEVVQVREGVFQRRLWQPPAPPGLDVDPVFSYLPPELMESAKTLLDGARVCD